MKTSIDRKYFLIVEKNNGRIKKFFTNNYHKSVCYTVKLCAEIKADLGLTKGLRLTNSSAAGTKLRRLGHLNQIVDDSKSDSNKFKWKLRFKIGLQQIWMKITVQTQFQDRNFDVILVYFWLKSIGFAVILIF